jgi:2-phosphoglycerate kinase
MSTTHKIFLIGGAPTIGKTYLAERLSLAVGLPWLSTDIVRSLMQKVARKDDYPALFYPPTAVARDYLEKNSSEQIVVDQNKESVAVWQGVTAILENPYPWEGFIIEGVAVLPEFVVANEKQADWQTVFLYDDREERIRQTIFTRGLWDDADKYADELKEKEVAWVMLFNDFIKREAKKYGFPLIEYRDDNSHWDKVLSLFNI